MHRADRAAGMTRPAAKPAKRGRGRPGGADSRARILSSAGKLFASRGYSGVSMRELAQAAKVNLGAINYHFGGKAKLYHETTLRLIDDIGPVFGPIIRQLREEVAGAAGDGQALARCVENFLRGMLHAVLGKRSMRWQMAFLLREFHQPSREFPMLLRDRIGPMHDAVGTLVAAALLTEHVAKKSAEERIIGEWRPKIGAYHPARIDIDDRRRSLAH